MVRSVVLVVVAVVAALGLAGCRADTPVQLWVDGFAPDNVRFEVEDLGAQTSAQLAALARRPDVDGAQLLPAGACEGPCRAALVTVFVNNRGAEPEPPPVVRLDAPAARARRLPIAFRDQQIERGRIGRIRWLVELWPEERSLTATLSSSVRIDVSSATAAPPAPPAPAAPSAP